MDGIDVLIAALRVVGVFALVLLATIINVWAERKIVADFQNRLGPMRAGPYGILQTLADAFKLMFKEAVIPRHVVRLVYLDAQFALACSSLLVYAGVLAGWSSGSKYPLHRGMGGPAQATSCEAAMGLALLSVVMFSATYPGPEGGTLSVAEIVERQAGTWG